MVCDTLHRMSAYVWQSRIHPLNNDKLRMPPTASGPPTTAPTRLRTPPTLLPRLPAPHLMPKEGAAPSVAAQLAAAELVGRRYCPAAVELGGRRRCCIQASPEAGRFACPAHRPCLPHHQRLLRGWGPAHSDRCCAAAAQHRRPAGGNTTTLRPHPRLWALTAATAQGAAVTKARAVATAAVARPAPPSAERR